MKNAPAATYANAPVLLLFSVLIVFTGCFLPTEPSAPDDDPYAPENTISTDYFGEIRQPEDAGHSMSASPGWYADARFYHIWVNAFADSDGDGIGDIPGITERLDYLNSLGVNALWLSPIFETRGQNDPQGNMHGYDTTDHYEINPYFGDKTDVAALLDGAHQRGMRVIFDYVPNHISNEHPWFLEAYSGNPDYRDWFTWSNEDLDAYYDGPWSNPGYEHQVWHDPLGRGSYYYGIFWDGMPDLNFTNPDVRRKMADALIYWLNFGFDGIRIDAVKYLYEEDTDGNPRTAPIMSDADATIEYFAELREEILGEYEGLGLSKFMVLENWTGTAYLGDYARYQGRDAAHMSFDFEIGDEIINMVLPFAGNAEDLRNYLDRRQGYGVPAGFEYANFLSNHDNVRSRPVTETGNIEEYAALAAGYNILLPGVPFVYYGNEVGMTGTAGADINLRQDFPWSEVVNQTGDDASILEWYRAMLTVRTRYASVGRGVFAALEDDTLNPDVFAGLWRAAGELPVLFVGNHSELEQSLSYDLTPLLGAGYSSLSTVVGAPSASISASVLSTGNLPPHSFRVYVLGSDAEAHIIADRPVPAPAPAPEIFILGTFDGASWEYLLPAWQMTLDSDAEYQYSYSLSLNAGDVNSFKFYGESSGWLGGMELEEKPGGDAGNILSVNWADFSNIVIDAPVTGMYTLYFDWDDRLYWVDGP